MTDDQRQVRPPPSVWGQRTVTYEIIVLIQDPADGSWDWYSHHDEYKTRDEAKAAAEEASYADDRWAILERRNKVVVDHDPDKVDRRRKKARDI